MIILQNDHLVFICINHNREESKSLERQRQSNLEVSISTKFRIVVQGGKAGVLQDVLFRSTSFQDKSAWWEFKRYDDERLSTFGTDQD
jgi:hypothetical protein